LENLWFKVCGWLKLKNGTDRRDCRGLGKLKKIKQVMTRIKQIQANVIFLQESHMTKEEVIKIERRWQGQVRHVLLHKPEG